MANPTPANHYREAENLLAPKDEHGEPRPPTHNELLKAAVHAILALAPFQYATTIQVMRR